MRAMLIILLIVVSLLGIRIKQQRRVINDLIELNHDKSQFIDTHCKGFTGTEEKLANE
jgi:hypothetical protein